MYFVFDTKTRQKSVSRDDVKILVTGKEMTKVFPCDCLTTRYSRARENVKNGLILTLQEEKNGEYFY